MSSLKEIVKDKIISELKKLKGFKVLVVDKESLKLLNASMSMTELLEQNISQVQDIFSQRNSTTVCYFISNSLDSINQIIKDFSYYRQESCIDLICSSQISDNLFDRIKQAPIKRLINSFVDLGIDFIPLNLNQFSLEQRVLTLQESILNYELQKQAKQITSCLILINEYPYIRYYQKPLLFQTKRQPTKTSRLAFLIQDLLKDHYLNEYQKERSTMLILDRTIDISSLLIHDVYYQAMLADLAHLIQGKLTQNTTLLSLDETDPFWLKTKTLHIGNVVDFVTTSLSKFTKENKAAQFEQNSTNSNDIEDLKSVLTSFGDYQDTKKIVSKHTSLCAHVSDIFKVRNLEVVVDLEQRIIHMDLNDHKECKSIGKELDVLVQDRMIRYFLLILVCLINRDWFMFILCRNRVLVIRSGKI
jgi:syntaxin-binding protein 1